MAGRWLRKHRTKAQAIAFALVAITLVSTVSAITVNEAKKRESNAKQEALAHFQNARRSIDKSLIELSDSLQEYPGVQELRTRLLQDAAKEYQSLAEQKSDQPELQLEIIRSLVRLAEVHRLLRDFEKAEPAFQKALTALKPVADANEEQADVTLELATCLNGLGLCWHKLAPIPKDGEVSTSVETADEFYVQAEKTVRKTLKSDSKNVELQRMLARITSNRGSLLASTDRLSEAYEASSKAVELYEALASDLGERSDKYEFAQTLVALAMTMSQQGDFDDARKTLSEAIRIYDRLVKLDRNSTPYLRGLADARLTLANAMSADGALTARLSLYEEAAVDYRLLVTSRPDVPAYRSGLVVAETAIAQVLYRLGENESAYGHAEIALEQAMAIVAADLSDAAARSMEIYATVTFGQILRDLNRFDDARLAFSSSDEICRILVDAYPKDGSYRRLHGEVKNNVGILLLLEESPDEARQAFLSAIEDFDLALGINSQDALAQNGRAWALTYLADTQLQLSDSAGATKTYRRALAERAALCGTADGVTDFHVARTWLLLTCPVTELRNVVLAGSISQSLITDDPDNGRLHVLQALAQLRAEKYPGAITSLDRTARLRMSLKSTAGFIRAMALWLNGDKPGAITAWEAADKQMSEAAPGDIKLRRMRIEAATLLGIELPEKVSEPESGNGSAETPELD